MSELWRKSAVELAAMIREREVSSRELRCLAIAEAIEQRLGPLTPIDPVAG